MAGIRTGITLTTEKNNNVRYSVSEYGKDLGDLWIEVS